MHVVSRRAVFVVLLFALGLFLVLGPVNQEDAQALDEAGEQELLDLINGYRQANGVAPLVPSEELGAAALGNSEYMASIGGLYHDGLVWAPADVYAAQNVAPGAGAQEVFEMWLSSPIHNANMLDPNYSLVGIESVGGYWTADFASGSAAPAIPETAPAILETQDLVTQTASFRADPGVG